MKEVRAYDIIEFPLYKAAKILPGDLKLLLRSGPAVVVQASIPLGLEEQEFIRRKQSLAVANSKNVYPVLVDSR